jgi:hypothetical protein
MATETISVPVSGDAYVDMENPDTNFGSANLMVVKVSETAYTSAFMQFYIPTITKHIQSVKLNFYTLPTSNCSSYEAFYYFSQQCNAPSDPELWESTINYNNYDYEGRGFDTLSEFVSVGAQPLLQTVDITSNVRILQSGAYFHVGIDYSDGDDHSILHLGTREGGYGAFLTIETVDLETITRTLNPTDDTFVDNELPNTERGSICRLKAFGYCRSYMKFDLSEFITVESCSIRIVVPYNYSSTVNLRLDIVTSNWAGNTLTYNNSGSVQQYSNVITYTFNSVGTYDINLTSLFTAGVLDTLRLSQSGFLSIRFYQSSGAYSGCQIYSTDCTANLWPILTITGKRIAPPNDYYVDGSYYATGYHGSDSNDGLTPDTPWLTLDHAARNIPAGKTLNVHGVFINEPPGNLIAPLANNVTYKHWNCIMSLWEINPGTQYATTIYACDDNTVFRDDPDYTDDWDWLILEISGLYPDGSQAWSYIQFDISELQGMVVHTAVLRLTSATTHGSGRQRYLRRVDAEFDEATLCWNTKPETVSDHTQIITLPVTLPDGTVVAQEYDIKLLLQDAINAGTGYLGLAITSADLAGYDGYDDMIFSKEQPIQSRRPVLTVVAITSE